MSVIKTDYVMDKRKEDILRLVEAQIAGNVDLSPEEMVDAAFIMVDKIDERCRPVGRITGQELQQLPKVEIRNGSI